MPRSAISACRGSNLLSACMRVFLKSCFRYSLWTCLIPYLVFFIFRFLIILPVTNIMCQDMVFGKPMVLMCMRSQHSLSFLYLPRMPLGVLGNMTGSTCWILCQTFFPFKCGTLSRYMSSAILASSQKLGCSVGCYYQLRAGLALLVSQGCSAIDLCSQPSLHNASFIFFIFLHLWYGLAWVVYHDVWILVF